ncbi:MAG: FtsX-like permease family protein [Pseudomonadota bacterium]
MIRLVLAHMLDRPMPVALNTLLIAFSGALLLTLASLSQHLTTRFANDMADIDLVVSAKGSPLQVILSSLFHVDVPTGNIPLDAADALAKDPLVGQAIPIAVGDRFRGFRVVGTNLDYLALYKAKAQVGAIDIAADNAVIGAAAARALSITIGQKFAVTHGLSGDGGAEHDSHPLIVTAILAPTGTVLDRLIVTSVEAVWEAHGIEAHGQHDSEHVDDSDHDHENHHDDEDDHDHEDNHGHEVEDDHDHAHHDEQGANAQEVTALLIRYGSPLAAVRLPQKINEQTDLMSAVPAYETARLLSVFGIGRDVAQLITAGLALLGGFAIFASLWSALDRRETDMALYRLLGAQPPQILSMLLLEGALTAAIGALGAWAIARIFLWWLWHGVDSLAESGFVPLATSLPEIIILTGIVALGAIAALPAGIKAARTPLERALA